MECAELACWHALINLIAVRVAQQFFSDFTPHTLFKPPQTGSCLAACDADFVFEISLLFQAIMNVLCRIDDIERI